MEIPDNYSPVTLILALRRAQATSVQGDDGVKAALVIDGEGLSDLDRFNLAQAFVGDFIDNKFYHWICNHFLEPIQFNDSLIAFENAESQKRNLETRLLYDIYRRTGVKLEAPHKDAVQLI